MVESDETRWHGSKPWTWSETRRHVWPSIVEARDEPTVSPDKRDDALWKDSRGEDEFDLYERLARYTEYFSSSFDTCLSTYLYTSPLSTSGENLKMFQFPWIYIRDNESSPRNTLNWTKHGSKRIKNFNILNLSLSFSLYSTSRQIYIRDKESNPILEFHTVENKRRRKEITEKPRTPPLLS